MTGGSSFEFHVAQAAAAIDAGLCIVAVIAYGSTQRSVGRKQASAREVNPYETPFKPFLPTSAYALAAARHMHQFGTTREQFRRGRGRGAQVGAAQSGRMGEEGSHGCGCAEVADDLVSVHGARLLPGHRWRRRGRDHFGGAREILEESAGLYPRLRPRRDAHEHLVDAGPDRHGCESRRRGCLQDGEAVGQGRRCGRALRRLHHQHDPVPRRPRLLPEGRGRGVCLRRQHRAGRQVAGQHQRRRAVLLPSRHVRPVHPDRGRAPVARRMRRAAG